MQVHRAVTNKPQYRLHVIATADGSRIREYVNSAGVVFAVQWSARHKPNVSLLLGDAYAQYAAAAQQVARRGGVQRNFRQSSADLVVQASGHLHLYNGYAYHPSLLPAGFNVTSIGQE